MGLSMEIGERHCGDRVVPALQRGCLNQKALVNLRTSGTGADSP